MAVLFFMLLYVIMFFDLVCLITFIMFFLRNSATSTPAISMRLDTFHSHCVHIEGKKHNASALILQPASLSLDPLPNYVQ